MAASVRARRWWAIGSLSSAVLASALLVPPLVAQPRDPAPVAGPPAASPTVSPTRSASASARPSVHPFETVRIAATDPGNKLVDVTPIDCPTCASGSRIQYLGQGHALIVHIRGVKVGGRRKLTIVYETAGARPLNVIINGERMISLTLKGRNSWTVPAEVSLPIDLPAGDTVIRLFHGNLPAPDIDQIVIS